MLKVIREAWQIPDGSRVTKRTGTKVYTLRKKLAIINGKTIKLDGVIFLIGGGNVVAVDEDTELVWLTNKKDFFRILEGEILDVELYETK